jgi:hypothetical protein
MFLFEVFCLRSVGVAWEGRRRLHIQRYEETCVRFEGLFSSGLWRMSAYCLISGEGLPSQASREFSCGMIGLVDPRS